MDAAFQNLDGEWQDFGDQFALDVYGTENRGNLSHQGHDGGWEFEHAVSEAADGHAIRNDGFECFATFVGWREEIGGANHIVILDERIDDQEGHAFEYTLEFQTGNRDEAIFAPAFAWHADPFGRRFVEADTVQAILVFCTFETAIFDACAFAAFGALGAGQFGDVVVVADAPCMGRCAARIEGFGLTFVFASVQNWVADLFIQCAVGDAEFAVIAGIQQIAVAIVQVCFACDFLTFACIAHFIFFCAIDNLNAVGVTLVKQDAIFVAYIFCADRRSAFIHQAD